MGEAGLISALTHSDFGGNLSSFAGIEAGDAGRAGAGDEPGGRVAVIVRAIDVPARVNLPLNASLKSKVEVSGLIGAGAVAGGCADASLYQRFHAAGLTELTFFPQLAAVTAGDPRLAAFQATNPRQAEPGRGSGVAACRHASRDRRIVLHRPA
jgi:hypothetical protein